MSWVPEEGEVVLGKYRVVKQLGLGGTGVVFKALNVLTDAHVALKVLNSNAQENLEFLTRMSREARAAASLKSHFSARVFDFDHTSDGSPVLIMELLEGNDLREELRTESSLTVDEAVGYVVQACAAVGEAHGLGIVHRDLKPGNIFLDRSNPTCAVVRVLDFGLAKDLSHETMNELTGPNDALGTLAYMSPEQLRAAKDVGPRTDVWALGVILYRALMGAIPLEGQGVSRALHTLDDRPLPRVDRPDVSPDLVNVIACALEKNAARRFPDARAFGLALRPMLREPSPSTTLAFEELAKMPSPRDSLHEAPNSAVPNSAVPNSAAPNSAPPRSAPPKSAPPKSVPPKSTAPNSAGPNSTAPRAAAATSPEPVTGPSPQSQPPPQPRGTRQLTRETRYLLAGSAVLAVACVVVVARTPHAKPRAVPPVASASASSAVAGSATTPPIATPSVLPLPEPVVIAPPTASSPPRVIVRPKPVAPKPAPAPKPTPEEEIPVRY